MSEKEREKGKLGNGKRNMERGKATEGQRKKECERKWKEGTGKKKGER